jgi:hypothetical protein
LVQLQQIRRIIRLHQIAQIDHQCSSACVDGSDDICVLQLHAGGVDGGLVCLHCGRIGFCLGTQLLGLFMGNNTLFFQAGVAVCLDPGILRLRLIVLHLANGFCEVRLERPFVQLKQQLALVHILSFFEEDFLDLTVDLGPDLHGLVRFNVADGLDLNRNVLLRDTGHDHRCRWTAPGTACHLNLSFVSAPGYKENSRQKEEQNQRPQSLDGVFHEGRLPQA